MTTNGNSGNRPKPPVSCTPCRVTYEGIRYQIESNGEVRPVHVNLQTGNSLPYSEVRESTVALPDHLAKLVRREAARQRRNRANREKYQAMKDLGMVKTPYGWE